MSVTPSGIEPATFRFVAQHLNHRATAVPRQSCTEHGVWIWKGFLHITTRLLNFILFQFRNCRPASFIDMECDLSNAVRTSQRTVCFRLESAVVCCDGRVQHVTTPWGQNTVLRVKPAGVNSCIND